LCRSKDCRGPAHGETIDTDTLEINFLPSFENAEGRENILLLVVTERRSAAAALSMRPEIEQEDDVSPPDK